MDSKDLLLELSLDPVNQSLLLRPGREDIVLKQLLGDGTRSLRELEAVFYSDVQSTDNTLGVDSVVLIKTTVFDGDHAFLKVFRYIVESNGDTVRVGCGQFLELISLRIINERSKTARRNIY